MAPRCEGPANSAEAVAPPDPPETVEFQNSWTNSRWTTLNEPMASRVIELLAARF
jgi:hypothetical protein